MKALILVGGFGTRLRPLTLTCPKPLVEFANKPMVIHQIEALKEAGCTEVILAISYRAEIMSAFCQEWEAILGIKITVSKEDEPLGTAGPLGLARHILDDGSGEPFFVLNSDVICDYPLKDMMAFHKQRGAEATLLVTQVVDWTKYGVVVMDSAGKVDRFVEKPKDFVGDLINAGIYVCSPTVLKRISDKPTSIEKEVFPYIAQEGKLFGMVLDGYWMDVGQPKDFLVGQALHLQSLMKRKPELLAKGDHVQGAVIIDETATVGTGCSIGPDVSIGPGCVIGDGVRLSNCVIMKGCKSITPGAEELRAITAMIDLKPLPAVQFCKAHDPDYGHPMKVQNYAYVHTAIVGWYSKLGRWSRLDNNAVLGEDVSTKDEVYLNGAVVLPHKEIKESVMEARIIM